MASLLCFNPPPILTSPTSSSSASSAQSFRIVTASLRRFQIRAIDLPLKSFNGVGMSANSVFSTRLPLILKASEVDGASPADDGEPPSESKEEAVPIENLPLESKVQQLAEQKLRMKLAKKIRMRRKRLLRKRRLRKKGRWPPSKMKKLKNV